MIMKFGFQNPLKFLKRAQKDSLESLIVYKVSIYGRVKNLR